MEELCRQARDDDRLTLTGKNRWVVNSALYIHQCGFEHCAQVTSLDRRFEITI